MTWPSICRPCRQRWGCSLWPPWSEGLWWLRRRHSWREVLLFAWIAAPVLFFELWPVKGFQYLLPIVAPVTILAARALLNLPLPGRLSRLRHAWAARSAVIAIVFLSLLIPTWSADDGRAGTQFLAGSGGVPGGRETRPVARREYTRGFGSAHARAFDGEHHPVLRPSPVLWTLGQSEPVAPQPDVSAYIQPRPVDAPQ